MPEHLILNIIPEILAVLLGSLLIFKGISAFSNQKQVKAAQITPADFGFYKKSRDEIDELNKGTINRLKSQLGFESRRLAKVAGSVAEGLKEGDESDIEGAARELIDGMPEAWQGILGPAKDGIIKAIKEEENKNPGQLLKTVKGIEGKLGKSKNGSADLNKDQGNESL